MSRSFYLRRFAGAVLVVVSSLFGPAGCASLGETEEYEPDLVLTSTMDKSVYRPGEAVAVNVSLFNNSRQEMALRSLDHASIDMALSRLGDPETPVLREPVFSSKEPIGEMRSLAPGSSIERRFLLTRLTHYSGPMLVQVHYDPNPPGSKMNGPQIYGNAVHFEVAGDRLFERDPDGLILQEEAIGLAMAEAEGEVLSASAIIVEDANWGLYQTWVNLDVLKPSDDGSLHETVESFYVDPYKGHVRGRAKQPFPARLAQDKRFARPKHLPDRKGYSSPRQNQPAAAVSN